MAALISNKRCLHMARDKKPLNQGARHRVSLDGSIKLALCKTGFLIAGCHEQLS